MLVVKSLILSTLVDSARLSKHIYEAKLATEAHPQCEPTWVGQFSNSGLCDFTRAKGACYDVNGKNSAKVTTQCLESDWHMSGSYKCPSEASQKCTFGSPSTPPQGLQTPYFSSFCSDSSLGKTSGRGLCNSKHGHVGACFDPSGSGRTQCLPQIRVDEGYTCPADAPSKCQFSNTHFSLADVEVEVSFPQCDSSWVGKRSSTGLCDFTKAKGACHDVNGENGAKVTTQCLESDWHMTGSYKCPPEAPTKCIFGPGSTTTTTPPASDLQTPYFSSFCSDSTLGKTSVRGLCNSGHVGACYDSDGSGRTQCLPQIRVDEGYKCPADAPSKCQFSDSHFSLADVEEEVSHPQCEATWVGQFSNSGLCDFTRAKGACYDVNGKNSAKVTTQCLESDWHMSGSYKCPSEASTKCTFGSPSTPPAGLQTPYFSSFCSDSSLGKTSARGLCNSKHGHVGACFDPSGSGRTQCLPQIRVDEGYTCPADAPSKCQFSDSHFSLADVEVEVSHPQCDSSWVGKQSSTGLCDPTKAKGACHDVDGKNGAKVTTQCLESDWHMSGSYNCPPEAPTKCTFGSWSPTPVKPSGDLQSPYFSEFCSAPGLGKTVDEGGDGKGECGSRGNTHGHVGACYDPSGSGRTQCLPQIRVDQGYKCPADAPSKCQFSSTHFSTSLAETFKEEGTVEGNCLCEYGGRTHYCNHGGNGMCVCGMNSWDWKRQSTQCGRHR